MALLSHNKAALVIGKWAWNFLNLMPRKEGKIKACQNTLLVFAKVVALGNVYPLSPR